MKNPDYFKQNQIEGSKRPSMSDLVNEGLKVNVGNEAYNLPMNKNIKVIWNKRSEDKFTIIKVHSNSKITLEGGTLNGNKVGPNDDIDLSPQEWFEINSKDNMIDKLTT